MMCSPSWQAPFERHGWRTLPSDDGGGWSCRATRLRVAPDRETLMA
jgi:hypothetical protein